MADFFRRPDQAFGRQHYSSYSATSPTSPALRGLGGPDHIRGHWERQADGSVLYKVIFDVQGYAPEDLRTSLIGDRSVQVAGSTSLDGQGGGQQGCVSFQEQFTLPDNVDAGQLRSVVINNQLVVSAPAVPPRYRLEHQTSSGSAKSTSPMLTVNSFTIQPQQQQQPQQHQQQQQQLSTIKRLNVYQLTIDLGCEFSPADVRISTVDGGARLVVHGQRHSRSAGKASFREFRDEFDLPSGLDLARMTARLRGDGRVVVEAPFRADTEQLFGAGSGFEFQNLSVEHR